MNASTTTQDATGRRGLRWLRLAAAATLLAGAASVLAAPDRAAVEERYLQERAVCERLGADQDRAACLREAGAARAQALEGALNDGAADHRENSLARCRMLQGDDRRDCLSRMSGAGSVSGSVEGGGVLREYRTRERGAPGQPGGR
jgi:hypothetical protein